MTQYYCSTCGSECALRRDDEMADCKHCRHPGRAVRFHDLEPELQAEWEEKAWEAPNA